MTPIIISTCDVIIIGLSANNNFSVIIKVTEPEQ